LTDRQSAVIPRTTLHYERPLGGRFTARSFLSDPLAWRTVFTRTLRRRGRARIAVSCLLEYADCRPRADFFATMILCHGDVICESNNPGSNFDCRPGVFQIQSLR